MIASWRSDALLAALDAAGVPAGPINDLQQVFADPHVRAREMCVEVSHPLTDEAVRMVANPVKMSATPIDSYGPPPMLGQHTDDVLRELLCMSQSEIDALREKKVL